MFKIAAYPGQKIQVGVAPYDEQHFLTSENFRILESSDSAVSKNIYKYACIFRCF